MSSKINNSFPKLVEQIVNYNDNMIILLTSLSSIVSGVQDTISIKLTDTNGTLRSFNLPTVNHLKSELERLNNNLNSLYGLNDSGALLIQGDNKFKKIITIDLNREPNAISELSVVSNFKSDYNNIFDGLMDPILSVEYDLNGKIDNNVRKILSRRYIVDFNKDSNKNLTSLGQSALNSFNQLFKNKKNILIEDFESWYRTTPGVVDPNNPSIDEQIFDLEPNSLKYDGVFTVLKVEDDTLNRKQWYHLNTLTYIVSKTGEAKQLTIDDEVIVNTNESSTRYKVIEISTASSNIRVRFELIEGIQAIPVAVGAIKIYSPLEYNKKVKISVAHDEHCVIFLKPINTENNLLAKTWSLGSGFWTNDLILDSDNNDNGKTFEQYYVEKVNDYGQVLRDFVQKKIPSSLGNKPNVVTIDPKNFKVVQINQHLTDTPDIKTLREKHDLHINLKSELQQLTSTIENKTKEIAISKFTSVAAKKQAHNELSKILNIKDAKSKLLNTTVSEIIDISKTAPIKVDPKFRVRGFWAMPEAVQVRGSRPQEVVQFRIQYRYLSINGKENNVETFKITNNDGTKNVKDAAFSNWTEFLTDARKRVFDEKSGLYLWEIQNVSDADTPNINQLDISINPSEKVEIRIKSISEVGFPEAPLESDWSDSFVIEFPSDLSKVVSGDDFILKEATKQEQIINVQTELSTSGLLDHIKDTKVLNEVRYDHDAARIYSGVKDENGIALSVYDLMNKLQNQITALNEKINRIKGVLKITVFRNNEEFVVKNNAELVFNVECEDYLNTYSASGLSGRVYANNIYTIKDFLIRVENTATDSPLGLLSNRSYFTSAASDFFNSNIPQVFFVDTKDDLLFSTTTGNTRTQLDNQFIWACNYESASTTAIKLADDIGNIFSNSNCITEQLGSTEFNVGYKDDTILKFKGNNNSLLEMEKWVDKTISVGSTEKLLTTIHPVVPSLDSIVETNSTKVKEIKSGENNVINIPINIYFKMNAINPNAQGGVNFKYIDLNNAKTTIRHVKKLKFFLENEAENRPFIFTIKFNINRNKVAIHKSVPYNSLRNTISLAPQFQIAAASNNTLL